MVSVQLSKTRLLDVNPVPAVCVAHRGQQGPRPGPTVAKGWRAGCVMFPGRCPKSETCHTAKQTLSTFPKIVFSI